ncbi:MAG: carboxypeptidase regulatory-like domain-containing protein, partial [Deltaproteobacteria bacterium]|nr:carboxypeptidase regulatory-like domain-containing protein [Deltaproteobacteria bacterium]
YSKALDLAGNNQPTGNQVGHLYLSQAIHKHHGTAWPMMDGTYVIPIPGAYTPGAGPSTCYYCHPGNDTQCLRSVMAVQGMSCQSCHGDLLAVGGFTAQLATPGFVDPYLPNVSDPALAVKLKTTKAQRRPWQDMPKCQSCHWGDALNHFGKRIVNKAAFISTDEAATPILAPNSRFRDFNNNLYQYSYTHGGVACQACHGSTHAEWPARINTNDNVTAMELQGHTGEIAECGVCHGNTLPPTLGGPHGLHNINDPVWLAKHGTFYRQNAATCQACHGTDLKGTVISRAKADRKLVLKTRNNLVIPIAKGTPVSCYACHTTIQ